MLLSVNNTSTLRQSLHPNAVHSERIKLLYETRKTYREPLHRCQTRRQKKCIASLTSYNTAPETAKIALRTGVYITIVGAALLLAPLTTMGILFDANNLPSTGWIRVGGILTSLFGSYYIGAARDDLENRTPLRFYQSTVTGRLALTFAFTILVAFKQCEVGLLWLALANLLSAGAMQKALDRAAGTS